MLDTCAAWKRNSSNNKYRLCLMENKPCYEEQHFSPERHELEGHCVPEEVRGRELVPSHSSFTVLVAAAWLLFHGYVCCHGVELTITQKFVHGQSFWARSVSALLPPKLPEFRRPPHHPHPCNKGHLVPGQCFRCWDSLGPGDLLSVTVKMFIPRNVILTPSVSF